MIMNGLTKDHKESRQHNARVLHIGEWSVQRDATLIRERSVSQPKCTRRLNSTHTIKGEELYDVRNSEIQGARVTEQIVDAPLSQVMEDRRI